MIFAQASTSNCFIDVTDQSNTKGNLMLQPYGGNVGIGTTDPIGKLDVRGAIIAPVVAFAYNQDAPYLVAGTTAYNGDPGNTGNWNLHGFEHRMKVDGSGVPRITVDDGIGNEVFTIKNGGNIGIGSSSPSQKLDVNGSIQHKGLVVTSGSNVDQITSFTKSLSFTDTAWKDTSISGTDLVTGSYMVQIYSNEQASNMNYHEYYTGFMSWYDSSTNSTESSEIILHAAGENPDSNHIYLRVLRQSGNADLKLQMRRDIATNTSKNYIFKFRRMM
jgi:hypothetical protein